jgi:YD repeat-containing protein
VPNKLNQYELVGNSTNSYDADGNLRLEASPSGTTSYTFDEENRPIVVATTAGVWEYEYDAFENRVAVVGSGQQTEFMNDPTGLGSGVCEYENSDPV